MRRTLPRLATAVGGLVIIPVTLGLLVADPGHADDNEFDDVHVSINSGPVCWELPNPEDPCEAVITLSRAVHVPVTVSLATVDGTAVAPQDYAAIADRVAVPAGDQTLDVPLRIERDGLPEQDEWFQLTISSPSVGSIGSGRAELTIRDGSPPRRG